MFLDIEGADHAEPYEAEMAGESVPEHDRAVAELQG